MVDELRKAAETLRERANAASSGGWIGFGTSIGVDVNECTCSGSVYGHEQYCGLEGPAVQACEEDIAYIVTVQPVVGLALADWLDDEAKAAGYHENRVIPFAAKIARLINGGAS